MNGLAGKRPLKKPLLLLKKGRYTKSTFIKIFTYSIFISLCVLLLTLFILYYSFKNIVTKEIHNQSINLLIQTQSIFNSLHEWIIPSFRQIKSELAISTLINSKNLDKIEISAGIDRLLEVLSAYYLVDSIYLYNHQTGQYFSTINGYEGTECSDTSLSDILHNIRRFGVYRYIPRKMTYRIHDNVYRADFVKIDTVNVFSIVVGDMPDSDPFMKGALIVNISEQKIKENFFPTHTGTNGRLIIIDREGKVLTHPDKSQFGTVYTGVPYIRKILASGKEEGVFADTFNGVKYLISYTTHPAWGWRFVNVMPYEEIFSKLTDFLLIAVVVFVLLMFLSIGLAYISSLRIYSPIHKLFQYALNLKEKVKEQAITDGNQRMSELQYVDRVFKEIIKNADNLSYKIEKHQEMYKQDLIRELVLGELDSEALENYWEYLGNDLAEGPFIIAVMRLDNFQRLSEAYHADEISRFFHVLKELVSHYISVSKFILPLPKDHICIICNLKSSIEEKRFDLEELKTAFSTIQADIERQLNITIAVGLSDLFTSYTFFHEKYNACLAATQFRFRFGCNAMISIEDVENTVGRDYIFPEDKLAILFKELALGKIAKVEQLVDEILLGVKEYNFEDYNYMVQFITYQTAKYIEKMNKSLKSSTINLKGFLQLVKSAETLEELKNKLMETYTLIMEICQKKQGSRLEELAKKIKSYIEQHFQDVSLCTDSLSDIMGVTAYYIRFAYKKVFGVSLSETINNLRLEYCKDQLLNTKLPAKKIYQTAGFYNYSYFFTLFKKNTGLTPNQFRFQKINS